MKLSIKQVTITNTVVVLSIAMSVLFLLGQLRRKTEGLEMGVGLGTVRNQQRMVELSKEPTGIDAYLGKYHPAKIGRRARNQANSFLEAAYNWLN